MEGLKARKKIAQGKASPRATPWVIYREESHALKGLLTGGSTAPQHLLPPILHAHRIEPLILEDDLPHRLPAGTFAFQAGAHFHATNFTIPAGAKIRKAAFAGTADNSFTLLVNGLPAGHSDDGAEGWRNPVALYVTPSLHPGRNQLAISAVNGGGKPNPAGLIGCLAVELESGAPLIDHVGWTWKASNEKSERWAEAGFDDRAWVAAREFLPFGGAPWGMLAGKITLSPVQANPFLGHCHLAQAILTGARIYLKLGSLAPETAARVTVNGLSVGGFIGKPARLDVSPFLKPGPSSLRIEPSTPNSVKLAVYPKPND